MSRALDLAERAVRAAEGDEADASVHVERSGFARFAASAVHQPTLIRDESVTVRVVRDGRVGCATTNRTDEDGLTAVARRAGEAAERSPVDPGFPGLEPPAAVPAVEGFDEETAAQTPEDQAEQAAAAIDAAPDLGLYGYYTSGATEVGVASTTGHAVAQATTDVSVLTLAAGEDVSGYAEATSWRASQIDPAAVAREAAEKAARTKAAEQIEPATYRAVLEPYAISELLFYFGFTSLNALALLEGRSYLSGRLGEKLFGDGFTLWDDGLDPRGYPKAFDLEGVPKQRVLMVEEGVARDVVWDRRTAKQAGARVDRARAERAGAGVRAGSLQPFPGRWRRGLGGRARRARRRRDLRHAPALPRRRRPPRGDHHRDDARRHLPRRGREGDGTARQPPLHDVVPGARRGPPGAHGGGRRS